MLHPILNCVSFKIGRPILNEAKIIYVINKILIGDKSPNVKNKFPNVQNKSPKVKKCVSWKCFNDVFPKDDICLSTTKLVLSQSAKIFAPRKILRKIFYWKNEIFPTFGDLSTIKIQFIVLFLLHSRSDESDVT